MVRFESTGVVDDVEVGWSDCSLADTLACQEEIIPAHTHRNKHTHEQKRTHSTHTVKGAPEKDNDCSIQQGSTHSPLWFGDDSVDDGTRRRVGQALSTVVEHPAVDPLFYNYHCQLWTAAERGRVREGGREGGREGESVRGREGG